MSYFIKRKILQDLAITPIKLETIFKHIHLNKDEKESLRVILKECKRLPASLNYHGKYTGALFDHTLLVANFSYHLWDRPELIEYFKDLFLSKNLQFSKDYSELALSKILQTALYHDFGKIPHYAKRIRLENRKVFTTEKLDYAINKEIQERFDLSGKDSYVDKTIGILKRRKLPYDNEIYLGIIFHHGQWSKYKPFRGNKLSELIHLADMIASQHYDI